MKKNFIISYAKELWKDSATRLCIADPYVYYELKKNNEIGLFEEIEVKDYLRQNRADLEADSSFVDEKYEKYLPILTDRLNRIHKTRYSQEFWRKSLSMGFIRYITALYDTFRICETFFSESDHECNILSEESYYIPSDFEDNRFLFQNSDYGQEQIFSIYINLFYPGKFPSVKKDMDLGFNSFILNKRPQPEPGVSLLKKIYRKLRNAYISSRRPIHDNGEDKIQIGILGAFFAPEKIELLASKSNHSIRPIHREYLEIERETPVNTGHRNYLSKPENDFDKFDTFFFSSFKYGMPRVFVENFNDTKNSLQSIVKKYTGLKYVISESWISNTNETMLLAFLGQEGVKHINNEHNSFFHPFAGSFVNHVIRMSDVYATMGWEGWHNSKVIKAASLFPFTTTLSVKEYKILFISGTAVVKMAHFSSVYGYSEENMFKIVKFNTIFFDNLDASTFREISYREYPRNSDNSKILQLIDKEYLLADYLKDVRFVTTNESSKEQMAKANLVVLDYISTSYIESLSMNIPTVVFLDTNIYFLKDEYSDFFKPLVDAGIFQTDPVEAAKLVEAVKDNPNAWWNSDKVQNGRLKFLSTNLAEPQVMVDYLLSLVKN